MRFPEFTQRLHIPRAAMPEAEIFSHQNDSGAKPVQQNPLHELLGRNLRQRSIESQYERRVQAQILHPRQPLLHRLNHRWRNFPAAAGAADADQT